jgi:hypothetical protein
MIKVELFPTLVCKFEYKDHLSFKQVFNSLYSEYTSEEVGESNGQNNVHQEKQFEPFYNFVIESCIQYCKELNLCIDNYYIVIGKSWMSFIDINKDVPMHAHGDHHLSFTYYIDLPYGSNNKLGFSDHRINLNEPYYGAFTNHMGVTPNISNFNQYNNTNFELILNEGELCIFPSKLNHWARTSNKTRKCIAGDFLLINKNINNKNPWGIYPQEHWKIYETKMD